MVIEFGQYFCSLVSATSACCSSVCLLRSSYFALPVFTSLFEACRRLIAVISERGPLSNYRRNVRDLWPHWWPADVGGLVLLSSFNVRSLFRIPLIRTCSPCSLTMPQRRPPASRRLVDGGTHRSECVCVWSACTRLPAAAARASDQRASPPPVGPFLCAVLCRSPSVSQASSHGAGHTNIWLLATFSSCLAERTLPQCFLKSLKTLQELRR